MGDLDGDGKADLVTAGDPGGSNVTVLLNSGTGTFPAAAGYASGGSGLYQTVITDLDGDGSTTWRRPTTAATRSRSSTATATARCRRFGPTAYRSNPIGVAIADFNSDGRPDIATGTL